MPAVRLFLDCQFTRVVNIFFNDYTQFFNDYAYYLPRNPVSGCKPCRRLNKNYCLIYEVLHPLAVED